MLPGPAHSQRRELGETELRICLLGAWREANLYSEQERAALGLTDAMTRLAETQDMPNEVYAPAAALSPNITAPSRGRSL